MPIAAINPFEGKTVEVFQPLTAGQLDWKLGTDVGPLATAGSLKSLRDDVRKTVDAGGRLLTRGNPLDRPGFFYAPTVLTDIPLDSPAYREEFFGPVASLFRVTDIKQAIHVANYTRFGLGASVWTGGAG